MVTIADVGASRANGSARQEHCARGVAVDLGGVVCLPAPSSSDPTPSAPAALRILRRQRKHLLLLGSRYS